MNYITLRTVLNLMFFICVLLEAVGVGHAKVRLGWLGLAFFALGLVIS